MRERTRRSRRPLLSLRLSQIAPRDDLPKAHEASSVTEPEHQTGRPAADAAAPQDSAGARKTDQVNGPSSTIGIGTGLGIGCLVLIVLLVVFGFVARSAGWL